MITRRPYIDCLRGVAVLVMLVGHTFDAWTADAARPTEAYRWILILAGFGAPLFLWLAGLALALSAERAVRANGSRHAAALSVFRRGLEVFILAFLFRLQAFVLSPGSSLVMLFRVDILNVMGLSIAAAGLVWGLRTSRAILIAAYTALALLVAMSTPIVRTAVWVRGLPVWVQWHLVPAGEYTNFTLFPWAGFVLAGSAAGVLIAGARDERAEGRVQWTLAAAGAALTALGFHTASLPSIYRESSFWTSSPAYFAIRTGVMMLALVAVYGLSRAAANGGRIRAVLECLGRRSLFVYWIHVELVYGYASWPIRHRLGLWQTGLAWAAFSTAMYGAVLLRARLVGWGAGRGAAAKLLFGSP